MQPGAVFHWMALAMVHHYITAVGSFDVSYTNRLLACAKNVLKTLSRVSTTRTAVQDVVEMKLASSEKAE
ncbi:hypothetical protein X801_01434 [Opisthorchis viverrini]|uniref:Uncharacterized protein n=1 Tax=Opisthorchis viverrini TaxID=6198 RepID=A0A1S8X895_OPIVI|nr:hypothetical protein X801_01434 [Opisthorchis viverrini]